MTPEAVNRREPSVKIIEESPKWEPQMDPNKAYG